MGTAQENGTEAVATHYSAGYWWCERCTVQRQWMEQGERRSYPRVALPSVGFTVKAGRAKWLQFAQEAGYSLVERAVSLLREEDDLKDA